MPDDQEKRDAMERVEAFLEVYRKVRKEKNYNGYDKMLMETVRLVDATPTGVTWELDVTDGWININDVMHGGAYAVIFDMCTAMAMNALPDPGQWEFLAGVSRSLNISYLKAVPPGVTIRIKCEVIQCGRRMALLRGVMESVDGKTVYATVEHHKSAIPPKPEFVSRMREGREKRKKEKARM